MAHPRSLLLLLLLAELAGCSRPATLPAGTDRFADLALEFADPSPEFSTAPFWVWNDLVTREKIDLQLRAFKDQGIDQLFIHPRPGLITEYLSDEWFALCRYALERAEELNMRIWLYDENSFPSGFAGGHVQARMPESYDQGTSLALRQGTQIECRRFDDYVVVLQAEGDGYSRVSKAPDQFDQRHFAFEVVHEEPSGWYGGFPYVDLLLPGVTEEFLKVTMEGYERALGEAFGGRIPGIFTDEPNIAPERHCVRYSPILFDAFAGRWGYDLRDHLPSLFLDEGEFRRTRYHYYRLLLELFIERWAKPWSAYTENRDLLWTGHYWEHGWPSPHHGPDNMAMYAWHQVPGIDMLFNAEAERPDQFGNVRAVKELSSAANQLGRRRTLSETYGAAGWELTFEDMKRLGDWQYALGVNLMNQHLSFMTLKGRRKGDFPQSFLTHAPYWQDFRVLTRYFARLSAALSHGSQVNSTLVLEPTTTAWMYYSPLTGDPSPLDRLEHQFRALLDTLEHRQIEYDLGSESILRDHGSVREGLLVVGERSYRRLLLPPGLENVDDTTFDLVRQFAESGGLVLSLTIPSMVNGEKTPAWEDLTGRANRWIRSEALDEPILAELRDRDLAMGQLPSAPDKVFHQRRQFEDGQLLFWVNFSREGTERISFSLRGGRVSRLDPLTGDIQPFSAERVEDRVVVAFELPAAGSLLLFVHRTGTPTEVAAEPVRDWVLRPGSVLEIQAQGPNWMSLDFMDLAVQGQEFQDLHFSRAADLAYRLNGLEPYGRLGHNPWAVAIQYRTNVLDMAARFAPDSGFTATYSFDAAPGFRPSALRAVLEWGDLYRVTFNGKEVTPIPGESWLDHSFTVYDLTGRVRPGTNQFSIAIRPMQIHAELEPVYLVGDFAAMPGQRGFRLEQPGALHPGSWKQQGRPFYGGSVRYEREFEVPAQARGKVRLGAWHGTVARILLDGAPVGTIAWPPYELELPETLPAGRHRIGVEVVGSLKNLLGPHHGRIQPGLVTPWSWFQAPERMPPGLDYHQLDYGLFEDFELLATAD